MIDSNTLLNEQLFAIPQPRQLQDDRQTENRTDKQSKQLKDRRHTEHGSQHAPVVAQSTPLSVSAGDTTSSAHPPAHGGKAKKSGKADPTRVSVTEDSDIAGVLAEMATPRAASTPGQENNDSNIALLCLPTSSSD